MHTTIHTRRLLLRPLSLEDLHTTHQYASDPDNTRYMIYLPNKALEETRRFLRRAQAEWEKQSPAFFEFAMVLGDQHIGAVSVQLDETRRMGEMGWIVRKDHWGKGYATEAALAARDFAVDTLKVGKLIAHCDGRNRASAHVMEKIGMHLESDQGIRCYAGQDEAVQELAYAWEPI